MRTVSIGRFVTVPLLALAIGACDGNTTALRWCNVGGNIRVTVEDSVTAARFPFTNVTVYVNKVGLPLGTSGLAWVSSINDGDGFVSAVLVDSGTYVVTVRADGYQDWRQAGIAVERQDCRIVPVELLAKLQPSE